jgi:ribonuclease HI
MVYCALEATMEEYTEIAYTDGAVVGNPGPGGWAIWTSEFRLSEFLPWTTNNLAELTAILKVVEYAQPNSKLTIITDSKLAIGWLTGQFRRNDEKIDAMVTLILDIIASKGLDITYEKVKGHSQNLGNNVVDRMARKQAETAAYLRAIERVRT